MTRTEEQRAKLKRVRAYMRENDLAVVFLATRANFSWLTAGGLNYVSTATGEGVATLAVTEDKCYCLANAIEAPRMMAEELRGSPFELITFPWYDDAARREAVLDLVGKKKSAAASDAPLYGLPELAGDFAALRYSLLPSEVARYRKLGREVSAVMETVGEQARAGHTEWEIEALMAALCVEQGIRPFVRLVAADGRIEKFRHPIPTGQTVRKRLMYVLCGERQGLVVAASRLVNFVKLTPELRRRHEAVCLVDAAMILATRVGQPIGAVLQAGLDAYARAGFADQWRLHHQGGPTGYAGREFVATPGERRTVQANQAFAWNPSITGTKSEDTILATERGPELVTGPLDLPGRRGWPVIEVESGGAVVSRADILVK